MADIFDLFKKIESSSAPKGSISHIVVGLGNPGREYHHTRHNAGFLALDYIAERRGARIVDSRFDGLCGECEIGGARVLLIKPQTFMNNSGVSVAAAAKFYKIPPERVIIIYDDICFEVGAMRIRADGSAGGHNGMKSIISHLGSQEFPRVRIGVGAKPSPDADMVSWVLGKFPEDKRQALFEVFGRVDASLDDIVGGKIELAMSKFNK